MVGYRACVWVGLVVVLAVGRAVLADAEATFEQLFGEAVAAAGQTSDPKDDQRVAERLLDAAGMVEDDPALRRLLFARAHALFEDHPSGWAKALEALNAWAHAAPEDTADIRPKRIDLVRRYARIAPPAERPAVLDLWIDDLVADAERLEEAGDYEQALRQYQQAARLARDSRQALATRLERRIDVVRHRVRLQRQIAMWRRKYEQQPGNPQPADWLCRTCVIELDRPDKALPYVERCSDEQLKKLVPLAAGDRKSTRLNSSHYS